MCVALREMFDIRGSGGGRDSVIFDQPMHNSQDELKQDDVHACAKCAF